LNFTVAPLSPKFVLRYSAYLVGLDTHLLKMQTSYCEANYASQGQKLFLPVFY